MTVSYGYEVATGKGFGNFGRLLLRWRGGVYNLVLPELLGYASIYAMISVIYRFGIKGHPQHQYAFDKIVKYCGDYAGVIPVSFVLGFYVSQIVTRWWNQFMTIPWPDTLAIVVATSMNGTDERGRLMRRTIMRYANLSFTMTMMMLSPQARTRFPTDDHLVEAGFMLPHEKLIFDHLKVKTDYPKYWIPLAWAGALATRARNENRIRDDVSFVNVTTNLCKFRSGCGDLLGYDWVSIPLVYTQVVTLAVYLYFLAALVGKQFIDDEHELDLYVPIFLFLEFFFYMGWLKVAETMVNPFGEDDDDFEVNWLIDRNFKISYMIVDQMHQDHPELIRDQYWDEIIPSELPYNEASQKYKADTHLGSAAVLMGEDYGNQDEAPFVTLTQKVTNFLPNSGLLLRNQSSKARAEFVPDPDNLPATPKSSYSYSITIDDSIEPIGQSKMIVKPDQNIDAKNVNPYAHLMERRHVPISSPEITVNVRKNEISGDPQSKMQDKKSL